MSSQHFDATKAIARIARLAAERADDWGSHAKLRGASGLSYSGDTPLTVSDEPYVSRDMVMAGVHFSQAAYALKLAERSRGYAQVLTGKLSVPQLSPESFREPTDREALLCAVANVAPTELDTFRDWVGPPVELKKANNRQEEVDGAPQTFRDLLGKDWRFR